MTGFQSVPWVCLWHTKAGFLKCAPPTLSLFGSSSIHIQLFHLVPVFISAVVKSKCTDMWSHDADVERQGFRLVVHGWAPHLREAAASFHALFPFLPQFDGSFNLGPEMCVVQLRNSHQLSRDLSFTLQTSDILVIYVHPSGPSLPPCVRPVNVYWASKCGHRREWWSSCYLKTFRNKASSCNKDLSDALIIFYQRWGHVLFSWYPVFFSLPDTLKFILKSSTLSPELQSLHTSLLRIVSWHLID